MAWDTSTRAARLPRGWKQLRLTILQRDGYRCTRTSNGHRCNDQATEVDHIAAGDNHEADNLASLCSTHHHQKTQHEAAAARWKHKRARTPDRHPGMR